MNQYWPLFDLHITTADLTLRPMSESDLAQVVDTLPEDVYLDPLYQGHLIGLGEVFATPLFGIGQKQG